MKKSSFVIWLSLGVALPVLGIQTERTVVDCASEAVGPCHSGISINYMGYVGEDMIVDGLNFGPRKEFQNYEFVRTDDGQTITYQVYEIPFDDDPVLRETRVVSKEDANNAVKEFGSVSLDALLKKLHLK